MSTTPRPPLVRPECLPGAGMPDVCDRCCATLPPRRRRWCSDECADAYFREHRFSWSRVQALKRDGYRCTACRVSQDEPFARGLVYEVDHIEAANGSHGKLSCAHHLDNLRTLCRPCHVKRTAEQRRSA